MKEQTDTQGGSAQPEIISAMPCPFCGSTYAGKVEVKFGDKVKHTGYRLRCPMCDAQTGVGQSDETLRSLWERRSTHSENGERDPLSPAAIDEEAQLARSARSAEGATIPSEPPCQECKSAFDCLQHGECLARSTRSATPLTFTPTHRHAEGGLYRVLRAVKVQENGLWFNALLYDNEQGEQFVRKASVFAERFTEINEADSTGAHK